MKDGIMPMCWKCTAANNVPNDDGRGYNLQSCKKEKKIHNFRDAEKLCPLILSEQKKNSTIILNREDVRNPLHGDLFDGFLETLGVDPEASEICLNLSPLDDNKKGAR